MNFNVEYFDIFKVMYALFLGGLIGIEREFADKPAGLRTHMLVTAAATLLVILGDIIVAHFGSSPYLDAIRADPIRIMEAIITGISFLGAGTIIFKSQKETIEGLTTAASILFSAGLGIAVALNQFGLASTLTIIVIIVLFGLGFVERKINSIKDDIHSVLKKDDKEK